MPSRTRLVVLVVIGLAASMALRPAQAGAYNPMRSCKWSITAACAAWRNGSYTRDGITHSFVGRNPNGSMRVHVYRGNARVK
jgi:hypothetical protein